MMERIARTTTQNEKQGFGARIFFPTLCSTEASPNKNDSFWWRGGDLNPRGEEPQRLDGITLQAFALPG